MNKLLKTSQRSLALVLACSLVSPSYAALGLINIPPKSVVPPIPNVILTLDDSGSMASQVDFVNTITYTIPPNANGLPRSNAGGAPRAFTDGYANPQVATGNINLSVNAPDGYNSFRAVYNGLPAADQQNYANWFSYYRTRNYQMKASAALAFSPQTIPDGRIRIAFQQLNANCNSFTNGGGCTNNRMRALEGTHRTNLFNWFWTVPPSGGTPLKAATIRAGEYLKRTGVDNPYANIPGTTELPLLSCRRSYHVVITDGGWNEGYTPSNEDNTAQTLPDGVNYTASPPYRGPTNGTGANSLADVAFRYWATDLQPGIANELKPAIKRPGSEVYGSATISEYWNPKNNPAKWQHMTMFAVGLGEAAELTPAEVGWTPAIAPTFTTGTTAGATFAEIVAGTRNWPPAETAGIDQRSFDLWHAAVNTRGEMFAAKTPDKLVTAFQAIVSEILAGNAPTGGSSSSLAFTPDFVAVQSGYEGSPTWRGVVKGFGQSSGTINLLSPEFDGGSKITKKAAGSRVIISASNPSTGVPFRWANVSAYTQAMLNRTSAGGLVDNQGDKRLNYLRGDRTQEVTASATPTPAFRSRGEDVSAFDSTVQGSVLGTIVNNEPRLIGRPRSGFFDASYKSFSDAYVNRKKVMYVGANDGMYHAFDASGATSGGEILMSYVPRGVHARLSEYTDPTYQHKYFVDGTNIVGDAKVNGNWKTFAAVSLGAGGRGFFVLDVTDPANFSESNASQLVRFDYTAPSEALPTTAPNANALFAAESTATFMAEMASDMGHIMGDSVRDGQVGRSIQIAQMQDGRWALITGNGVNSVNERPVLYIVYLDAAGGYQKVIASTATGNDNGLSTPLPIDTDGDGKVDTIYAGDLKGKLWKFKSNSSGSFSLSNGGAPLIDVGKPITSAPGSGIHPRGGLFLTFGTGRFYTYSDKTSTDTQTIYGVWDKLGTTGTVPLTDLVTRTLSNGGTTTSTGGKDVRTLSGPRIDYNTKRGWRMDLGISGERVIFNPIVGSSIAYFSTYVPLEGEACGESGQGGSLLAFSLTAGTATWVPAFDVNGDGKFTNGDFASTSPNGNTVAGLTAGIGKLSGILEANGSTGTGGTRKCTLQGTSGSPAVSCPQGPGRVMWRDLTP